ncbi:unnamed protein product [Allacma fusca]|uniref:UNC-45/Cro1/She4 central domain-containing protein n=1 Tax=Allacma fusca TaxID=39272 RepID=A0A8J2PEE7_9HEXA|nr:unnamed protein product [Allacma fusca]
MLSWVFIHTHTLKYYLAVESSELQAANCESRLYVGLLDILEGKYEESISLYSKGIALCKDDESTRCVLHKNAAMSYLKLNKFKDALGECDKALEISPKDPKTLYRRATALEGLERFEEAYRDAQQALVSSPGDAASLKPLLSRLYLVVEQRRAKFSQTKEKATKMMEVAFGGSTTSSDECETAFNNLMVLCRERAGIEALLDLGVLSKLKSTLDSKTSSANLPYKISAIRILSEIARFDSRMVLRLVKDLGVPFIVSLQDVVYRFSGDSNARVEATTCVQFFWQACLDSLTGVVKGSKPQEDKVKENSGIIDAILTSLSMSIGSRSVDAQARDSILQLFTKNIGYDALAWGDTFIEVGGLARLCELSAEVPELNIESAIDSTKNTRSLCAVLFSRVYDNMYYDKARDKYTNVIDEYVKQLLLGPDIEAKLHVVALLTVLLIGPVDVGNTFVGRPGIIQMILVMANSEDYLQQRVAAEAIIAAASKKDKAKGIIVDGINILKRLYQSKNDDIKVRALVGLAKLGSSGGTDASFKPFSEGANIKLMEACRRFLLNPAKDVTVQRWAVEGLSYLTLDAEVKEKVCEDTKALKALLELSVYAKEMGEVLYPIITCLVNLVNAYDKQEIIPEMLELAKFAKHHVPQEHEFDDPDFVAKRVETLVKTGITSCLVNLAKGTESPNVLELIARILNAVCETEDNRGAVVAQGGARELLQIFQKTTPKGKRSAAQALARVGITQPPSVAFPGQRMAECVKPLLSLLEISCTALENFEALLALCNLASESETLRKRIWEDQGYIKIEHYIYEDHQKLRMAAAQCLTNMALLESVQKLFDGENDRVKFLMLLSSHNEDEDPDEDDIETMKAASGTLAILSASSRAVCGKILTSTTNPVDTLLWLVANPMIDLQVRGVTIVANVVAMDKEFAEQVFGTPIFEVMMALAAQEVPKCDNPEVAKKHDSEIKLLGIATININN